MLKEQISDLKIKKILCRRTSSIIYLLSDGRVFKRFLFEEIERYGNKGISLENKIIAGDILREYNEFYGPLSAIYRNNTFIGYTMKFNKDKNLVNYVDSLRYKCRRSNLNFYANNYKKLEDVVKKGHKLGLVFPDLCTISNIFISKMGFLSFTDYDGFQVGDYGSIAVSSAIFNEFKICKPKFYNNGLYTFELDKYSLMVLFLQKLSLLDLSSIDTINPETNQILTTKDLAEYINLQDEEIINMIEDTLSIDRKGVYVSEVANALASKYDLLVYKEDNGEYTKVLKKK